MTADEIKALLEEVDDRLSWQGTVPDPLVARLAAIVRELTAWRPMSTAPRDGTEILVWNGSMDIVAWVNTHSDGWGFSMDGIRVSYLGTAGYWRPLPIAPEAHTTKKEDQ